MPRSLARTAVHPPHRIGKGRSSTPARLFTFVIVSLVVAVLCGIAYFSYDIWASHQYTDESITSPSGSTGSTGSALQTPKLSSNKPSIVEALKQGPLASTVKIIDSVLPIQPSQQSQPRSRLEKLIMPNRDNIISKVDEKRLVDIPPPSISNNNIDTNNPPTEPETDSNDDVDGSSKLDEPFDEETASHLIREDINPTNKSCKIRMDEIKNGDIWETPLKEQKNILNKLEQDGDNNGYIDWWDYPKQYQSKLDNNKYCSTIHKASYELHKTREDWFNKRKKEGKAKGMNSNKFDENGCIIYNKDDSYVQWHPPKELLCNWRNNATFWHTMHGTKIGWDFRKSKVGEHWVWDLATELNDDRQGNKCECPNDVAFIFADNQIKEDGYRLIERSYKYCNKNCNFFHVAKTYEPWDWYGKIGPVLELISNETFQKQFKYAILTDADDQTLIKSPIDIVNKFLIYDADMVIGGEDTSYPHWMRDCKAHENRASPWSKHHQHLNAGGFMGNIKKMIPYLEYMTKDYNNFTKLHEEEIAAGEKNRWRDQTCLREMYLKFYPKIKIDSLAMLWSRVDIYMYDL